MLINSNSSITNNNPKRQKPNNSTPTGEDLSNLNYGSRVPILVFLDLPNLIASLENDQSIILRESAKLFIEWLFKNFYVAVWNSASGLQSHQYTKGIFGLYRYELIAVLDNDQLTDNYDTRVKDFGHIYKATIDCQTQPGRIVDGVYVPHPDTELILFRKEDTIYIHSQDQDNAINVPKLKIQSSLDPNRNPAELINLIQYLLRLKTQFLTNNNLIIEDFINQNTYY